MRWGASDVCFYCIANAEENEREDFCPAGRVRIGFDGRFELAMETFDHAIGTLMIGSGANAFDSKESVSLAKREHSNWAPRSVVIVDGIQKEEIQFERKT